MVALDSDYAPYYLTGLRTNGYSVYQFLDDYKKYDNEGTIKYNYNWRVLNEYAKKWSDPQEAVSEAEKQCGIFRNTYFLRMYTEHCVLGNTLFAVWIALSSPDETLRKYAGEKLNEALAFINWNTLSRSYSFAAVGAFYKMKTYERL